MGTVTYAPTTTYRYCYRGDRKHPPPVHYYQIQSLIHRNAKLQPPRHFPIEPAAPHRILQKDPEGPVLGLGTKEINIEKFLEPKPILKTPAPQDTSNLRPIQCDEDGRKGQTDRIPSAGSKRTHVFDTKFGKMDSSLVNALMHKFRWTSTTKQAIGEACLPVIEVVPPTSTLEQKADMLRLHGQRYEMSVGDWQNAVLWDKIQTRGKVYHEDLKEKSISMPQRILLKRINEGTVRDKIPRPRINSPKIRQLVIENNINNVYLRQCPGYAGFVPRQPPKIDTVRQPELPYMTSVMKASYRELPDKEYKTQDFARKGPMSKTVTLTYPFNPFNKVTCEPVLLNSTVKPANHSI